MMQRPLLISHLVERAANYHGDTRICFKMLTMLDEYEVQIRNDEKSGKIINQKLADKIGQIRLAYEVVAENKALVGKIYTNSQK